MIREEFFPTSVFGKDIKLDNDKLAQNIINWSNQDQGLQKTNYKDLAILIALGIFIIFTLDKIKNRQIPI